MKKEKKKNCSLLSRLLFILNKLVSTVYSLKLCGRCGMQLGLGIECSCEAVMVCE